MIVDNQQSIAYNIIVARKEKPAKLKSCNSIE
nr:MAG TPA: hypothetical protein [Caudoviricetes sp.]